jgi:hypothetical protein
VTGPRRLYGSGSVGILKPSCDRRCFTAPSLIQVRNEPSTSQGFHGWASPERIGKRGAEQGLHTGILSPRIVHPGSPPPGGRASLKRECRCSPCSFSNGFHAPVAYRSSARCCGQTACILAVPASQRPGSSLESPCVAARNCRDENSQARLVLPFHIACRWSVICVARCGAFSVCTTRATAGIENGARRNIPGRRRPHLRHAPSSQRPAVRIEDPRRRQDA